MKRKTVAVIAILAVLALACTCSSMTGLAGTEIAGTLSSMTEEKTNAKTDRAASATREDQSNSFPFATQDSSGNSESTMEVIETPSGPVNGKVGELVTNGKMRMMVHGWAPVSEDIQTPEAGKTLMVVDFTILYTGAKTFWFSASNFSIKDSEGRAYQEHSTFLLKGVVSGATLFKGEKLHTTIQYQIPKTASGLTFVYEGSSYEGFAKIFIPLGETSGVQNAPDTLDGEQTPDIQSAGSMQTCGKWKIQVNDQKYPVMQDYLKNMIPAGWKILALDLSVENGYTNSHNLQSSGSMWLQDGSGRRYIEEGISRSVIQDNYFATDDVAAGEKVRGWMGFAIPDKVSLTFVFWCGGEKSPYAQEKAYIRLPLK
jgi:hypothetical protein